MNPTNTTPSEPSVGFAHLHSFLATGGGGGAGGEARGGVLEGRAKVLVEGL